MHDEQTQGDLGLLAWGSVRYLLRAWLLFVLLTFNCHTACLLTLNY